MLGLVYHRVRNHLRGLPRAAVTRGCPPGLFGYRFLAKESVDGYFRRRRDPAEAVVVIHPAHQERHPLPTNVPDREQLPKVRGWWGNSFHDIPERTSTPTFIATLRDCRVVPSFDSRGQFWATIVSHEGRSVELRELSFRPWQARFLRTLPTRRIERATWVVERVYDNYSHWLTAHLPKLLMLRDLGMADGVLLPTVLAPVIHESLKFFGMPAEQFGAFDPSVSLRVDELTVVGTDRFRPELLRMVAAQCPVESAVAPHRRVFISRAAAARRRLSNEDDLWPILARAGFEKVQMERLAFSQQVALMRQTAVLVAPHGAGLANMMFCPTGARVVEIADLEFPNPNFYALAAAMGHSYWLLAASPCGLGAPPERDLRLDPAALRGVLNQLI
jgi:hypothetical protein